MPERDLKKVLISIIKWLLIALVLYFIFRQIVGQWDVVKNYEWRINWGLFVLSIIVLQIGLFFKSYLWSQVLKCFDVSIPPMRAFRVAYLSNLGRYVPGKIVQFVGIMYLAKKEGVREDVAVTSLMLTQFFDTPSGIILVFVYYLILGQSLDRIGQYLPATIILAVVSLLSFLIILVPGWLERLLNLLLKLIKRPALTFRLEKKTGFTLLFLYFIAWTIFGAALYLFLRSVSAVPSKFFLESCIIYTASYLIGYWALFAPGGIGVREAAMGVLLQQIGGLIKSIAYTVGLATRLWFMVGELTVSIFALMVGSKKKHG